MHFAAASRPLFAIIGVAVACSPNSSLSTCKLKTIDATTGDLSAETSDDCTKYKDADTTHGFCLKITWYGKNGETKVYPGGCSTGTRYCAKLNHVYQNCPPGKTCCTECSTNDCNSV